MTREVLMKKLSSIEVKVCGTSEDFGSSSGGVWVSLEEGLLSNHNTFSDEFHNSKVNKIIEDAGYFLEQQDSGTAFLWKC